MLAQAEMPVVFVPGETISQGSRLIRRLTAGNMPKSFTGYGISTLKVPQ